MQKVVIEQQRTFKAKYSLYTLNKIKKVTIITSNHITSMYDAEGSLTDGIQFLV